MTPALLKKFIRYVFRESPMAVIRGYVLENPRTLETCHGTMGARKPINYTIKELAPAIDVGMILIGAFGVLLSREGGLLNFRTEVRIYLAVKTTPLALEIMEREIQRYMADKLPDHVANVAGRTWDPPQTKAIQ
jgi:hypothetical protein